MNTEDNFTLPADFSSQVMLKIEKKMELKKKRYDILSIIGYSFAGLLMLGLIIVSFDYFGIITFEEILIFIKTLLNGIVSILPSFHFDLKWLPKDALNYTTIIIAANFLLLTIASLILDHKLVHDR